MNEMEHGPLIPDWSQSLSNYCGLGCSRYYFIFLGQMKHNLLLLGIKKLVLTVEEKFVSFVNDNS